MGINCVFLPKIKTMPYNLPQRKSPRARWHDYTGADYFVTFCTKNRELYFGDVVDGQMELSEIGKWAVTQIEQTAIIRQNDVEIPMFVVMPNHVHLIVVIGNNEYNRRDAMHCVSTGQSLNKFAPQSKNLSSIIRGIKISTTMYARKHNIPFMWQTRFHDRIIRSTEELNAIADYIENNVAKWEYDKFYA